MSDHSEFLRNLFHPDDEDPPAKAQQPVAPRATDAAKTTSFLRKLFTTAD
ncbi:hypothetical protein [Pseudarthrobacter sp. DSP2-3-2b1]